jgi:hypothetical protein
LREPLPIVVREESTMWGIASIFIAGIVFMIVGPILLVVMWLAFA